MDYEKILKYANDLEKSLELDVNDIDERVEEEKEQTDIPEPALEASEEEKQLTAYLEACESEENKQLTAYIDACEKEVQAEDERQEEIVTAAEKLVKVAKKLQAKEEDLTAEQEETLKAYVGKIAKSLRAFGEDNEQEEDPLKKGDLVKKINQRFTKDGKLLIRLNWKLAPHGIGPQTKLRDITLDDLRRLLTIVK